MPHDEDFESGFAEAAGETPVTEDTAPIVEQPEEEVTEVVEAEPTPVEEDTPTTVEEVPETEPAPDWKALYEKEQQRFKSLEGRFKAEVERKRTVVPAPPVTEEKPSAPLEDDPTIKAFQEEFPEFVAPIQALIKSEARRITEEELRTLREKELNPVRQAIVEQQGNAHVNAILRAHPDAVEITESGALSDWLDTLPSFIRDAGQRVYAEGSTSEVIELYNQFKAATKPVVSNTEPKPTAPPERTAPLAVPSRPSRAIPRVEVDKGDFNAGWEAAIKGKR